LFHQETLDLYAVRLDDKRWALSDAGGYDTVLHSHATLLLASLIALLAEQGGELALVLLTHGHVDHVGALPLLLAAWPKARVVAHEAEAPYLIRGKAWSSTEGSAGLRLATAIGFLPRHQNTVPADRVTLLSGSAGKLSGIGAPGLSWHHLPGHSPSHVVYIHKRSGQVLAGDIADVLLAPLPGSVKVLPDGRVLEKGKLYLFTMTALDGADAGLAAASLCRLAFELPGWTRAVPYHDATKSGLDKRKLQQLVREAGHASACSAGNGYR
jgi:glyoxylase-like metal-dependent hydrolase (beta-lactamase superfamily II)